MAYAGESLLATAVARWVAEEGLGLDVCSGGELATALAGGVDPARIIMHGNAKTPDELHNASTVGAGRIVVDSPLEIAFLAGRVRGRQQVLIRVTPDIDIDGHHAVTTGVTDQKFGFALADGHAAGRVDVSWISRCSSWPACTAISAPRSATLRSRASHPQDGRRDSRALIHGE